MVRTILDVVPGGKARMKDRFSRAKADTATREEQKNLCGEKKKRRKPSVYPAFFLAES